MPALHERPEFRLTGLVEADETYVGAHHERGAPGRTLRCKSLVAPAASPRGWRRCALQEFVYRTNRRWLEHDLFFYALRRAVQGEPLPWARLTAEAMA